MDAVYTELETVCNGADVARFGAGSRDLPGQTADNHEIISGSIFNVPVSVRT
jgi:hypothetical protein